MCSADIDSSIRSIVAESKYDNKVDSSSVISLLDMYVDEAVIIFSRDLVIDCIAANRGMESVVVGRGCISDRYISGYMICCVDSVLPPLNMSPISLLILLFDADNSDDLVCH